MWPFKGGVEPRKRQPWLICGLLVTCALVQVAANRSEQNARDAVRQGLRGAQDFFSEHPYLEAPPPLVAWLGEPVVERWRADYEAERQHRGILAVPGLLRASRQQELDQQVRQALTPFHQRLTRRLALDASRPGRFVSHLLVHAHWLHLAGNLLLLAVIGGMLETAWGRGRLIGVGLASLVASAAAGALLAPAPETRWIGSSGLAAGCLGAFAAWRGAGMRREEVAALLFSSLWLGVPPALGLSWSLVPGPGGQIPGAAAAWAGTLAAALAAGVAAAVLLRALRKPASPRPAPTPLDAIRSALARGESSRACELWLALAESGAPCEVEPAVALRLAPALAETDRRDSAVDLLRQLLDGTRDAGSAVVAARVARAACELDPELAREAAWRALASPELELEQRQSLELLMAELWRKGSGLEEAPAAFQPPAAVAPVALPASSLEVWEASEHSAPEPELLQEPESPAPEPVPEAEIELALPEAEAPPVPSPPAAGAPAFPTRAVHAISAVPLDLDSESLSVEIPSLGKKLLPLAKLEALAVASVAEESTVLVDLVLNWSAGPGVPLQVLRLRPGQFDPRVLVPEAGTPAEALRAFIEGLLECSGALALPDTRSARGRPYASFASLDDYTRDVLLSGDTDPGP